MPRAQTLREQLQALREELDRLRAPKPDDAAAEGLFGDAQDKAQELLDEAETLAKAHPLLAVAGALALGFVLGRLTLR